MILFLSSTLAQLTALARIYKDLLRERRFTFLALLILALIGATFDSIGVALVMPLLAALQNGVVTTPLGLEAMTRWTENSVVGIAAIVGAVFVVKNLLALARIRGTLAFTYGMWRQWVERIVRNVVHGPVLTTEALKPGAFLSISLTQSLESIIGIRQLFEFGVSVLTLTCIYFMLWLVSWPITLGLTVLFVVFALFGLRPLTRSAHAAGASLVRGNEDSSTTLLEIIGGIRYVKAFCQERQFEGRVHKALDGVHKSLVSIYWLRALAHPLLETSVVLLFCVAVIIVGRDPGVDLSGHVPTLAVFAAAAFRVFPILGNLGNQWVTVISKKTATQSVLDAMNAEEKEIEGSAVFSGFRRSIVLRSVSYTYPGRPAALVDVSFVIEKGRRTALVGESGSGKSTVIALLLRFLDPDQGQILVDEVELPKISLASWRGKIGCVGQEGFIFNATIAENISLGRVAHDDPRLAEVATVAGLDEAVRSLPQGYETLVGERGLKLSGGQRQRVSLARALLERPEILVLDEATSALDNNSATRIFEAVGSFLPDSTVVTVTHRLHHTSGYDSILVLREGRIVERGTHDELLKLNGYYHQLFEQESIAEKLSL